jgi:hypothetical protein
MADIFISYSKESRSETERLARELQAKGFTVWWDTRLVAGESFRDLGDIGAGSICGPAIRTTPLRALCFWNRGRPLCGGGV